MWSLVLMLIPPDAQMFLSMTKAALALPRPGVTSDLDICIQWLLCQTSGVTVLGLVGLVCSVIL